MNCITEHDSSHTDNLAYDKRANNHAYVESQNSLNQDKRISSEVFFACENCGGPLIQYAFCRICKKTDLRICLKCNNTKTFGDHRNCLRMVLLDMKKILSRNDRSI